MPDLCRDALQNPTEVPETYLDGCLGLLEGVAKGSDAGRLDLCESGMLDNIIQLAREGDAQMRVRGCHALAEVLETLSGAAKAAKEKILAVVEASPALAAKVLALTSHPLLEQQRSAIFRLLSLFVREAAAWSFTRSSLLSFIVSSADTQKDSVMWRYSLAREALALGAAHLRSFLTQDEVDRLQAYASGEGGKKEAKADVRDVAE